MIPIAELPDDMESEVLVTNVHGQIVLRAPYSTLLDGERLVLNIRSLAPGNMYFCQIPEGKSHRVVRFVKQ